MTAQGPGDLSRVGLVHVDGVVSVPGTEPISVKFLVDSGAYYSLLPHDIWTRLGLRSKRTERFELADGTVVHRQVSEAHVAFEWGDGHTPVILGEPSDTVALLGALTLEEFGYTFDPFSRSLKQQRLFLMRMSA
jgi:clan AA aspartic protease